jgi:enoyl-CoA hydratase
MRDEQGGAHLAVDHLDQGVVVATLNRPEKYNALTFEMFDAIAALARKVEEDSAVRVLILTGAGKGFCAGLDLDCAAQLSSMSAEEFLRGQEAWANASLALTQTSVPVIAAVNGPAAGAGLSLALACDIRIASKNARFNAAFVRIGLTGGDMGSSWLLPRLVGLGMASELLLTGRFVEGDEALRIGLVNRVVDHADLLDTALGVAREICANTAFGVRLTKRVIASNLGAASLAAGIDLENRNQALAASMPSMDAALAQFLSSRRSRSAS